jgi:hypothetical protein
MDNYEIFWLTALTIITIYSFFTSLNSKNHDHILIAWFDYFISLAIWIWIFIEPNTPLPINSNVRIGDWGAKEYTHLILFCLVCYIIVALPFFCRKAKEILIKLKTKGVSV